MRPRSSLLDLFDPLASQELPSDAQSADSDKENCLDSDFSLFGLPSKPTSPVRLKRRLVDVGDITIDDPMLIDEELDDSMCDDDNDTLTLPLTPARDLTVQKATPSNLGPRTPLAELSIDRDISPVVRTKIYPRQPFSTLASSDVVTPASPENSSFAAVIDAVTASGVSFAGPACPLPEYGLENEDQPANVLSCVNETPQITITPIDESSNSIAALSLDTPPSQENTFQPSPSSSLSESSKTSISIEHPRTTLRLTPPKTSLEDKKRHSIDLYTSFHLQLQSEEASFDLLNDKISLFASTSSMDFLDGLEDDDSFDMGVEEAKLQATIDSIKLEEGERKVGDSSHNQAQNPDDTPSVVITSRRSSPQLPSTEHMEQQVLGSPLMCPTSPPVPSKPTKAGHNEYPEIPKQIVGEPSILPPIFCPPSHDQGCTALCTPAPKIRKQTVPPPVPALKIVKRSGRPGHEKSASTSSAVTAASEGRASPTTIPPTTVPVAPTPPPIMEHVSSTDLGRITHVKSAVSEPSAILPSTRMGNGTGNGPRRVPIIDSQPLAINKRRAFVDQKIMPQGNMGNTTGPRRIVMAPSVPVLPAAPVPAPTKASASGLKAPTKYGVGTNAAVSALPRPVSRLPTTSGIIRPPRAGVGANVAGTGHVKRAAYARRVV
ncbi:hypothetical protein E4T56_gene17750 [Termitomyces sp. T112]|nr:hypothetical protein E4T56_gene17750 [Termitomyces sp. T112]